MRYVRAACITLMCATSLAFAMVHVIRRDGSCDTYTVNAFLSTREHIAPVYTMSFHTCNLHKCKPHVTDFQCAKRRKRNYFTRVFANVISSLLYFHSHATSGAVPLAGQPNLTNPVTQPLWPIVRVAGARTAAPQHRYAVHGHSA